MTNTAKIIIGDSRRMVEVENETVDFIVTSPPYWHIKDYGIAKQIGYGQTLHEYLKDLYYVWNDCYRVLRKSRRLCINIGDQFARSIIFGRYKVIPIHAELIAQCEKIGFDFMGSIIWQKKTTMNTTGGANVMGSYPYPPSGIVEIDYEFIHIFKKPGRTEKVSRDIKEASKLSKREWKEYFSGHWSFGGARQIGHEAMFPDELPRRLIKMFAFVGDTVLDPFLGSGTTVKVALQFKRNAIAYEINQDFLKIIREKIGMKKGLLNFPDGIEITKRDEKIAGLPEIDYIPTIQDAKPQIDPKKFKFSGDRLYKVVQIVDENTIRLNTGLAVKFLGVKINKGKDTIGYLKDYILGKDVLLKFQGDRVISDNSVEAYVYLKNKIFVNAYLIKSGLASPDSFTAHKFKDRFVKLWNERRMRISDFSGGNR